MKKIGDFTGVIVRYGRATDSVVFGERRDGCSYTSAHASLPRSYKE
jgi:hypothetical protein